MDIARSSAGHNLSDITQCSICRDVIKNAKFLPCIHTFCLECLQQYGRDHDPGEKMACPLCREEFVIPLGGFEKLRNNFFIEALLELSELFNYQATEFSNKNVFCDVCSDDERAGNNISATEYCIECRQPLCASCSLRHLKSNCSLKHSIIALKEKNVSQASTYRPTYCEKHEGKQIELYCYDCKLAVCQTCYSILHSGHKCCDLKDSSELFKEQLKKKELKISSCESKCLDEVNQLEVDKCNLFEQLKTIEEAMRQRCDEVKKLVDQEHCQSLEKMCELKKAQLKLMTNRKDDIERQLITMKSFRRYSEELIDKGSSCDVSRSANDLLTRADALVLSQAAFDEGKVCPIQLNYLPSDITCITSGQERLIGRIVSGEM